MRIKSHTHVYLDNFKIHFISILKATNSVGPISLNSTKHFILYSRIVRHFVKILSHNTGADKLQNCCFKV